MKASGPAHERETIINANDEVDYVEVWTASDKIYHRLLKRLGSAYLVEDGERHAIFRFPAKWLILPKHKEKRVLTGVQLAKARQNIAKLGKSSAQTTAKSEFEGDQ